VVRSNEVFIKRTGCINNHNGHRVLFRPHGPQTTRRSEMKKLMMAIALLLLAFRAQAEPINFPQVVSKLPAVNQSYVVVIDDDFDQAHLTSFTVAKWKMLNFDIGYLSTDGLAVAISTDLIETPQIQFPILKYIQLRPIIGFSFDRLFSGGQEDDGFAIADSERLFIGAQILRINF